MGSLKHVAVEGEHRLLITRVVLIAAVFAGQEPFPARFVEAFCEVVAEKREVQDWEAGCLARLESHAEKAHLRPKRVRNVGRGSLTGSMPLGLTADRRSDQAGCETTDGNGIRELQGCLLTRT